MNSDMDGLDQIHPYRVRAGVDVDLGLHAGGDRQVAVHPGFVRCRHAMW